MYAIYITANVLIFVFFGSCCFKPKCSLDNVKGTCARSQIRSFLVALEQYKADTGDFPTTAQGLNALREAPRTARNWRGPYLSQDIGPDPWGRDYVYRFPGEQVSGVPEIVSYGADGKPGGVGAQADIESGAIH